MKDQILIILGRNYGFLRGCENRCLKIDGDWEKIDERLIPKLSDSTLQFSNLTKCAVFHFAYRQNSYCFGNFQVELRFIHQ